MSTGPDYSKIRAVFFDAGGTLFRPYPSVGEVYSEVAGRHGLRTDPAAVEKRFHEVWVARDGLARPDARSCEKEERSWWHGLVREVFLGFGQLADFDTFFGELYDRFARPETWRLFPDTLPVVRELKKRGKTLGIISNWDSRLFGICEGLGLRPHLDFILASAVVGTAKPHPRIFREALKQAGVKAGEALHVGDSLEDDVLGAQGAGIHAVFINRKGGRPSPAPAISGLQFLCGMFDN